MVKRDAAGVVDAAHILRSSATVNERIAAAREHGSSVQGHSETARAVIDHRMAAWARRLTRERHPHLAERLHREGVSLSVAAAACSPELALAEGPTPAWLPPVLSGVERLATGEVDYLSARSGGTPFADILSAFLPPAEDLLLVEGDDVADSWRRLPEAARRSAQEQLVSRLAAISQWCLYSRYDAARNATPHEGYEGFVSSVPQWACEFFNTFAGLARPLGHAITFWARNLAELLRRWTRDCQGISEFLGAREDLAIELFESFPSDPHNQGRTVVIIRLNSGQRIVYKPTPGQLSLLWQNAIALTIGPTTREPALLDKGEYAWHRHLHHHQALADSPPDAIRRLGELLALATALGTTDLHFENFIVTGSGPQLVDHETVLSPSPKVPRNLSAAERAATRALLASALVTGALPQWTPGPGDEIWNANAFGWHQGDGHESVFPFLTDANTSQMRVSTDRAANGAGRESAEGMRAKSRDIGRGFRDGWRAITDARRDLSELLREAAGANCRVMLRDTRFYAELLGRGYMPRYCHDVLDRSLLFEHLHHALLNAPPDSESWRLCRAEHHALIRGDIPCFIAPIDRTEVRETADSEPSIQLRASSPTVHAARNLRGLTRRRGERNIALIHSAFDAASWPGINSHAGTSRQRSHRAGDGWPARRALAVDVFSEIRAGAFIGRDDHSIALIGASLEQSGQGQRIGICPTDDTYAGIAGLGLLAAALHRCEPHRRYLDTALRVADTLAIRAEELARGERGRHGGAFAGGPGVAYVLFKLGSLLETPLYVDSAANLFAAAAESPEASELDVMSGIAGTCLVGAALVRRASHRVADVMPSLTKGATELRSRACRSKDRQEATWPTMGQSGGVSGFAHGVAGVAAALARLHSAQVDDCITLAEMALAREDAFFMPATGGWPITHRGGSEPIVTDAWCYGAAGILLALGEAAAAGAAESSSDMRERAVRAACGARPSTDGLCHGEAGVALALMRSGHLFGDDDLVIAGMHRLDALGHRHLNGLGIRIEPAEALQHAGGLMCGASGIAFAAITPEAGPEAVGLIGIA
jgi:type 2 lantibiotic biosynthesis protein LanM